MSKLIIVRHGRTAWHAEGRYAGTEDVPLDDIGKAQAEQVARHLAEVELDHVYSSPLSRCSYVADVVARVKGMDVTIDERLREIDMGRWDGQLIKDIIANDGELLKKWTMDPGTVTMPGGESLGVVQERSMEWLADAVATHPDGTILASSHGGPIRAMLAAVIGLPLKYAFRLSVDLASISIVNYKGKFSNLELLNETMHLADLDNPGICR